MSCWYDIIVQNVPDNTEGNGSLEGQFFCGGFEPVFCELRSTTRKFSYEISLRNYWEKILSNRQGRTRVYARDITPLVLENEVSHIQGVIVKIRNGKLIYMQSKKIHEVFQWVSLFSTCVSSTCFWPHRSIIRSISYKLYVQIWYVL